VSCGCSTATPAPRWIFRRGRAAVLRLAQRQHVQASGRGTLHSSVINHRPAAPGFTPPLAIAAVEPEADLRLMSNIVGCPQTPEALVLDIEK
jgi:uncharacterized OB-fold protein